MNDVFSSIEGVSSRALFGGYGLYQDGCIFGIIVNNELYFKVDDTNAHKFEKYKSPYFVYSRGKHKKTKMPYMKVPDEVLENKKEVKNWINESAQITRKLKK